MIISAIVPCYQESATIGQVLMQMSQQICIGFDLEILVVDGGSTDGTLEIAKELERKDQRIKIINNHQKTTNHAFNLGITNSKGSHFALINAHTYYPTNYLNILWATMQKTGAAGVSGRVIPVLANNSLEAQLVYCISTSAFGVSSESYRMGKSGFSHSVSLPLFEKKAIEAVGLYHPKLARNQDNEMNFKLIKAGNSLYVTDEVTASYHPPKTLNKLFKYAYKSGIWNTKTLIMGIPCMKWYHFIPGAFAIGEIAGLISIPLSFQWESLIYFVLAWLMVNGIYVTLNLWFSLSHPKASWKIKILLPFGFLFFHLSYGMGNLLGLAFKNKNPNF